MTNSPQTDDNMSVRQLGAELRGQRMARGLSLRALAAQLRLSGHGTLVDYEHGRRIPPEDLVIACERVLGLSDGRLRELRRQALAERAGRQAAVLLKTPDRAAPRSNPGRRVITLPAPGRRTWIMAAVLVILVAGLGLSRGLGWPVAPSASARTAPTASVRAGFEQPSDDWVILYGEQVAQLRVMTGTAYQGTHSLLMTVTGASARRGYSAVGTTHGLAGLRPGMRVVFHLWVPGPQDGGVRFFVQDSHYQAFWAPETAMTEQHLPTTAGWSTVTWTVPRVDHVLSIGMQVWTEYDTPVIVGLDAVNW